MALIINAVILGVFLISLPMMYETNDDYVISMKLEQGYPYIGFVNVFLCRFLIAVQKLMPGANAFIISQIFFSFLAFVCILRTVLKRNRSMLLNILAVVLICIYAFDHYCSVQFTKTSALLAIAGILVVVDSIINKEKTRYYVIGYCLFYLGVAYREKAQFIALAYGACFLCVYAVELLIDKKKSRDNALSENNNSKAFRSIANKKTVITVIALVVLAVLPYFIDKASDAINSSTEQLALSREYSSERVRITDYPSYEFYDENAAEIEKLGISKDDYYLIDRWYFDFDGAATLENFKALNKINADSLKGNMSASKAVGKFIDGVAHSVLNLTNRGVQLIVLGIISILFLIYTKPRKWLYLFAFGGLTVCVYIALYYLQRSTYRAFYIADIGATMWLLYTLAVSRNNDRRNSKPAIAGVCVCIIGITCLLGTLCTNANQQYEGIKQSVMSPKLESYFVNNKDCLFVYATSGAKNPAVYMTPLKAPGDVESNIVGTGGCGTLTPFVMAQLNDYGIDNPFIGLIDNDKVLYVGGNTELLQQYYNKWYYDEYGPIYIEKIEEIDGNSIYKVVSTR